MHYHAGKQMHSMWLFHQLTTRHVGLMYCHWCTDDGIRSSVKSSRREYTNRMLVPQVMLTSVMHLPLGSLCVSCYVCHAMCVMLCVSCYVCHAMCVMLCVSCCVCHAVCVMLCVSDCF